MSMIHKQRALGLAAEVVVQHLEQRRMMSSAILEDGTWTIDAEDAQKHRITIEFTPKSPKRIRAVVDGKVIGSAAVADVEWLEIYSGSGDDYISIEVSSDDFSIDVNGGDGDDTIIGGPGDDMLFGDGGDDSLVGGAGADQIYGDLGRDTIDGGLGDDYIWAEDGDDSISGGGGDDEIWAGGGDDDLFGDEGDDGLWGGWGDDDMEGEEGDDQISGGRGDDEMDGGDGEDDLSGGGGADELDGGDGDDELDGQNGGDIITGGWGDDSITGGRGADVERGGFGADEIFGQAGRDSIWGGEGADTLIGGTGSDTIYREGGVDRVRWGKWDLKRNDELVNPLNRVDDEAKLKAWLIDEAIEDYGYNLGRTFGGQGYWDVTYPYIRPLRVSRAGGVEMHAASLQSTSAESGASLADHSTTNTQEQGVDEADLVETDGQYIYSITGGKLVIIRALPAAAAEVLSTRSVEMANGMYLSGERLVVLSHVSEREGDYPGDPVDIYLYQSFFQARTKVTVYDISDRSNPTVAQETVVDGVLTSSREIDGRLYLILRDELEMPAPKWFEVGDAVETETMSSELSQGEPLLMRMQWRHGYRYETEQEYRARLEAMSLAELLPKYNAKMRGADGQMLESSGPLAGSIYTPGDESHNTREMSSVVLINLDDGRAGPTATTNIIGMSGLIYASAENMYITTQVWEDRLDNGNSENRTDIYRFGLGENSVELEATGEVPGFTLNSFSMDEEGEYFRIATTTDRGGGETNNVFVLDTQGSKMDIVGGVTGMAFSEEIYAARFVGDKAYLVTFPARRWGWDPLFTIDLSDPTEPAMMGELEIPGFSTYLHPIDDGHLLAVGRDGSDVQVSLFDVSDMSHPARTDLFTITGGWSNSAAERDHHAFAYFPEHQILALPAGTWLDNTHLQSTVLLKVDPIEGLTEIGTLNQGPTPGQQRNLRIGEYLYAFNGSNLKVVALTSPDQPVADVDLAANIPS